ncbi:MAG: DNA polymerase III subunit alpha, partial [Bacteroidales bacterium]|nr:DNA polymerase III subunit alpha [Bacteroidales bacterium]
DGHFTNVFNFVERVPVSACNKKTIESLALAGAFDSLPGVTREQFFATNDKDETFIDTLIRYGSTFQADQSTTMNSLFGDDFSQQIETPAIPNATPWTDLEKLNKERDLIGIYLSAHPLDDYELILKYVCNTSTADLADLDKMNGREVTFGGMVVSSREGQTRRGSPYTIFKVEDYRGNYDIALFGDDSINYGRFARPGLSLFIRGRVQTRRYDQSQFEFKINSIQLLPDVKDTLLEKLTIQMPLTALTTESVANLSALLKNNSGNTLLYFHVHGAEPHLNLELFSRQSKIAVTSELVDYLKENEAVKFKVN